MIKPDIMKKSIILGFFFALLLNACMKYLALSDLEISDPSL